MVLVVCQLSCDVYLLAINTLNVIGSFRTVMTFLRESLNRKTNDNEW